MSASRNASRYHHFHREWGLASACPRCLSSPSPLPFSSSSSTLDFTLPAGLQPPPPPLSPTAHNLYLCSNSTPCFPRRWQRWQQAQVAAHACRARGGRVDLLLRRRVLFIPQLQRPLRLTLQRMPPHASPRLPAARRVRPFARPHVQFPRCRRLLLLLGLLLRMRNPLPALSRERRNAPSRATRDELRVTLRSGNVTRPWPCCHCLLLLLRP